MFEFVTALAIISAPVNIAVIDTGVANLPQMHLVGSYDMTGQHRNKISSQHGTWVASIIAANMHVPYTITSYRVDGFMCSDDECQIDQKALAKSIIAAVDNGSKIIQISSYGSMDRNVENAVRYAVNHNVSVLFAAGNHGGVALPGALANKIGSLVHVVGSVDTNGRISSWSARPFGKPKYSFDWQLGQNISVTGIDGTQSIRSGTSFSVSYETAKIANNF